MKICTRVSLPSRRSCPEYTYLSDNFYLPHCQFIEQWTVTFLHSTVPKIQHPTLIIHCSSLFIVNSTNISYTQSYHSKGWAIINVSISCRDYFFRTVGSAPGEFIDTNRVWVHCVCGWYAHHNVEPSLDDISRFVGSSDEFVDHWKHRPVRILQGELRPDQLEPTRTTTVRRSQGRVTSW